jgi:hypothetical protein
MFSVLLLSIINSAFTLLDVVVCQCTSILELLSSKDQSLLVRGDTCTELSRVFVGQHLC